MKVAVVGGGFTGLAAAYELTKYGHEVTLFESAPVLGGLAYGFREPDWQWNLEYSYHHWFTNDWSVLTLIKELGLEKKLIIKRPITANLLPGTLLSSSGLTRGSALSKADSRLRGNDIFAQLDSPLHLFRFPGLTMIDKLRTAALIGFLKLNPFWKPLENLTAEHLLTSIGGKRAYHVLWEPLLVGKFGGFAPKIQAAWFWARIKKRTPNLMYMKGGFKTLIDAMERAITKQGGIIKTESGIMNQELWKNKSHNSLFIIHNSKFDKVLWTGPTPNSPIPHLWAQTLILETDKPILKNVYWLNITDRSFPFLAAVAHTNFMDKKYYGGHHITYFGNYLPAGHKYLSMNKEELLKEFLPFIKKINPIYDPRSTISHLFTAPHAQPVHELNYSSRAPKLETTIPNVYLANMDSIFPWDRGTNYAIELGQKAAKAIIQQ